MKLNKQQRVVLSIFIPIIIFILGIFIIGSHYSCSWSGDNRVTFNPIRYISHQGIYITFIFILIIGFELFLWKDSKLQQDSENNK